MLDWDTDPDRPGAAGPMPALIAPDTDWEHAVNAWCHHRAVLDLACVTSTPPGEIIGAALRQLAAPLAAARLGHVMQWNPAWHPRFGSEPLRIAERRWTCVHCLAACYAPGGHQEARRRLPEPGGHRPPGMVTYLATAPCRKRS
jgi:hypothetical protein